MTDISFRESNGRGTIIKTGEVAPGVVVPGVQLYAKDPTGNIVPVTADAEGNFVISIGAVTVGNVEISNDVGNPVPVNGTIALGAGAQFTGKTGIVLKQVIGTVITRPSDITAYAIGDAISNSTSAPTLCEFDLAAAGFSAGDSFEIRRLVLAIDAKPAILPIITAYLTRTSFAHGVASAVLTDNSPIAIPNVINEAGGAMLACEVQSSSAINCRCAYISPSIDMVLDPASTKVYMCLQAANAFTPTSGMKITPIIWVVRL